MKKIILLAYLLLFALSDQLLYAQYDNVDFEAGGLGAGWTWTMDSNGSNPALTFPANPVSGGINTTATVAEFTALQTGQPWALTFTDDIDPFEFDATNSTVKIMVYKPTISNVAIKFEGPSAPVEINVANTVINQWEELTFDFSGSIGNSYSRLIVIPDFDFARAQDNLLYFDNIQIPAGNVAPPGVPAVAAPTPSADVCALSIFSDAYSNVAGTDFDPNWGQSTVATIETIAGNPTLQYLNLTYQGTQFGSNQDVSAYEFLHIDFWTENSTDLGFFLISPGNEIEYLLTSSIVAGEWVSVDIPLSAFVPPVDLTDAFQFKVDGNGNVWFDNLYFHGGTNANVSLPDAGTATSITCTTSCDDMDWTYYEDPNAPGNYLFAIEWDPAGLGNNGPAKTGAQVVIDIDATFTGVDDGSEKTWSMGRYWNVTPGAALVDPVNVKFFYDAAEKTAIETEMMNDGRPNEGFIWFKTTGVDFDPAVHVTGPLITGSAIELTDANTGGLMENGVLYAQFDGITSFSGGTGATGVGPDDSPLPVELTYFRAEAKGGQVELTWETASEENNDYFEIERSIDGRTFELLTIEQGAGNSFDAVRYLLWDNNPMPGTNYYRLKQVDVDGTYEYSNVQVVEFKDNEFDIYPNPATDEVWVKLNTEVIEGKVQLYSITGELLLEQTFEQGSLQQRLYISKYPKGIYQLRIENNGKVYNRKFIIH